MLTSEICKSCLRHKSCLLGRYMFLQRTIRHNVTVEGVGLHSGKLISLTFKPAPAGSGVHFVRSDLPGCPCLSALCDNITATANATTLGGKDFAISTVEHCLSALGVLRIDNLIIELNGPEIPIGDGSVCFFWEALRSAGIVEQEEPRKYMYITHPIYLGTDEKHVYVQPYNGLRLTCTIEFNHPKIQRQKIDIDINEHSFDLNLSKARTFGFLKDVEMLKSRGLIRGASLDNAVVLDDNDIINPEGLRYPDEFVRHKTMDALGDLVTLGYPIMGHVILYKAGHDLMSNFVKKVVHSHDCYRLIELGADLDMSQLDTRTAWVNHNYS